MDPVSLINYDAVIATDVKQKVVQLAARSFQVPRTDLLIGSAPVLSLLFGPKPIYNTRNMLSFQVLCMRHMLYFELALWIPDEFRSRFKIRLFFCRRDENLSRTRFALVLSERINRLNIFNLPNNI